MTEGAKVVGPKARLRAQQLRKGVKIKMVSTDMQSLGGNQMQDVVVVAKCKMDGDIYAALFDFVTRKRTINRLYVDPHNSEMIIDTEWIGNDDEWLILTDFFLEHRVYEHNRIFTWVINSKQVPDNKRLKWIDALYADADKRCRLIR